MNKIRCTGMHRGVICNRYLGQAVDMKGAFKTKCEKCNSQVTITDGKISNCEPPELITSQQANKNL